MIIKKELKIRKDIKELPIPKENMFSMEIITDYPNEKGRFVLNTLEKIKKFQNNPKLFFDVIFPINYPTEEQNSQQGAFERK